MSYIFDPLKNKIIDLDPDERNLGHLLLRQPALNFKDSNVGMTVDRSKNVGTTIDRKNATQKSVGSLSPFVEPALSKTDILGNVEKLSKLYDSPVEGNIGPKGLNPRQYKQMMQHLTRPKTKREFK